MIRTLILTASLALVAPAAMLAQSHPQNHPQGRPHGQAGHEPIDPKLHAALHAMTGSWHGSTHAADGASKKFNLTLATDKAGQVTLKTATDLPIRLGAAKAIALEGNTLRWTQEVSGAPCNATAVVKAATAQTADTMDGRLVCASGEIAFSVTEVKGMMDGDERADAALLAASADGDDAAFAVLVRRYIRSATLLAAQILGARDDAEDVVQDAFIVLHRKARAFDVNRPFAPWFFAIVRRLASNRRATVLRQSRLLHLWHWATNRGSRPSRAEEERMASLEADAVKVALAGLSGMQRACLDLVTIRGVSPKEVAAMHGISESTVRQHVFRARAALRSTLGTAEDQDE